MEEIGLEVPRSGFAHTLERGGGDRRGDRLPDHGAAELHPRGQGHRHRPRRRTTSTHWPAEGLAASPVGQILVEQSIAGWKEFELEVMRDAADNCVVVCSIENFDPMGVHTGDSITVAPAQTLTDVEYQAMRDDAFACLRRVGVETGGSNVQFAVDPATGRRVIIEMNPRVSRSLGPGLQGDRLPDRQDRGPPRRRLPARRDPQRHHPGHAGLLRADDRLRGDQGAALGLREAARAPTVRLGTRMQSVGEVMAIGRTFCESLQKALRSLEQGRAGPERRPGRGGPRRRSTDDELLDRIGRGHARAHLRAGGGAAPRRHASTRSSPAPASTRGSSRQLERITGGTASASAEAATLGRRRLPPGQAARLLRRPAGLPARRRREADVRAARLALGRAAPRSRRSTPAPPSSRPSRRTTTPPTRRRTRSARPSGPRVIILGSGPNRIGQGIEFDYCCVHASMALRDAGYETVMVNCNPETVSTDYDTSDRLYFEPLTDGGRGQRARRRAARPAARSWA